MNSKVGPGETAYAKLVSDNGKEFYINELSIEIGREPKLHGPNYFCLQESNTISKNHAKIFWKEGAFYISNLSKNKIYVNFREVTMEMEPIKLENMAAIMISKVKVYFLLP